MTLDLYAGIPVDDYPAALAWYEKLFGAPPTFFPNDTEAVWELAEHRSVYVEHRPEHAGHAMTTLVLDDLDALVAQITARGVEPSKRETYPNGVRKVTYHDADGNEIGFGGVAPTTDSETSDEPDDNAGDLSYDEAHGAGEPGPGRPGSATR